MKARAIQFTAILMILTLGLTLTGNAQNNNPEKSKVFTAFTLEGNDQVKIRLIKPAGQSVTINVFDETHRKVFTRKIKKSNNLLMTHDISEFPAGVYIYEIIMGKELVKSCKIKKSSGSDLIYLPVENLAEAAK